jgi:hypothetical protein
MATNSSKLDIHIGIDKSSEIRKLTCNLNQKSKHAEDEKHGV